MSGKPHGLIKHPLYGSWKSMKNRCNNPKAYNKLDVKVYEEWIGNFKSFYEWAINSGWQEGLVLSRKELDKDFTPDNCYFERKGKTQLSVSQDEINAKIKQTSLERYGVEHPSQAPDVVERRKQTCLTKYGTETALHSEEIQQRGRDTVLERYGVTNVLKLSEIKEKVKQTNMERYGHEYPGQVPELQKQMRKTRREHGWEYDLPDNKTAAEIAKEKGIAYTTLIARIQKFGIDAALKMENVGTDIENRFKSFLIEYNIPFQKEFTVKDKRADYLIDNNLLIEIDGLFWHSDAWNKDKNYHKAKKELYSQEGYRSLFFRENEIYEKFEIIKSIVINSIHQSNKIYARRCDIKEVNSEEANTFIEENHLMGGGRSDSYGLYYNNELVTILQTITRKDVVEIHRFCHKKFTTVVGGFSRLIKYIEGKLQPRAISTFIDQRYGTGSYLLNLGFTKKTEYLSFNWTNGDKVFHRMVFPGQSGYEKKYFKIWDCGQAKYEKSL